MEKTVKYCSIYTEKSLKGASFKEAGSYNINWSEILSISKKCGMVSYVEFTVNDTRYKITYWTHEDSYDKWSQNFYIQTYYINKRDSYNRENHIDQNLVFGKVDKTI